MRVHRLEIQAFGPFSERQRVDFDRLGEQGLFLLNGATGAGKTSVLDAICFALFGSVPGARQGGNHLRSDHAPAGLEPSVLLEFSANKRYFEVTRSPSWQRPKKTGGNDSLVTEQAHTLLREKIGGEWVPLSSRNDEASEQIRQLLGMNREQFTKVVMLAQGEFAAFLRAKVEDRQTLLQQLFGTERFKAVESELLRSATAVKQELANDEARLAELLRQAREAAAKFIAVDGQATEEPGGEETRDVPDFEAAIAAEEAQHQELKEALELAGRRAEKSESRFTKAQEQARKHNALVLVEAAQTEVNLEAEDQALRLRRLEQHRRAEAFSGEMKRVRLALQSKQQSETAVTPARTTLPLPLRAMSLAELEGEASRLSAERAVVQTLLPEEELLNRQLLEQETNQAERAKSQDRRDQLRLRIVELQEELNTLEAGLLEQAEAAGQRESRKDRLVAVQARQAAADAYRRAQGELEELEEQLRDARDEQLSAKQHWLTLMQSRLDSVTGELAAQLEVGVPCPVCGSLDHPQPSAQLGESLSITAQEKQARELQDAGEHQVNALAEAHAKLRAEVAGHAAQGGTEDAEGLQGQYLAARQELELAEEAVRKCAELELRSEAAGEELRSVQAAEHSLASRILQLDTLIDSAAVTIAERESKLLTERVEHPSIALRLEAMSQQQAELRSTIEVLQTQVQAEQEFHRAEQAFQERLSESEFENLKQVESAWRDATELEELGKNISRYQEAAIRAEQAMAAEEVQTALAERTAGVTPLGAEGMRELEAAAAEHRESLHETELAYRLASTSQGSVASAAERYLSFAAEIAPARERAQLLTALADTARGLGHNDYKMPLSAYVLAARLEQVAIAATERLQVMSDGRYALEHSDALAGRNRKSGLGLEVIDGWTGQRRDTSTLSGGESFMASLALALGLADVVHQESGGLPIDTLFVDEGFGSLDEESLDQVMTSLESLRDAGRVVGLVSHVAELKLRIPLQLQVIKGRHGSTLSMRTLNRLE
ncbi:exonuclease SbcC [Psychromicrobium silvestre]|uniref:Nuclease SbcCD subunit C n=1 Tax=Psychromicrobium silvestre TaxID=1645614 RepID=A0A7Y9S564_9MICC|nr:SMC family ATPase [Psychromicrobium silvestre]NYE94759.1 exonuclease SbcC [Psychromicrobium silvestre]